MLWSYSKQRHKKPKQSEKYNSPFLLTDILNLKQEHSLFYLNVKQLIWSLIIDAQSFTSPELKILARIGMKLRTCMIHLRAKLLLVNSGYRHKSFTLKVLLFLQIHWDSKLLWTYWRSNKFDILFSLLKYGISCNWIWWSARNKLLLLSHPYNGWSYKCLLWVWDLVRSTPSFSQIIVRVTSSVKLGFNGFVLLHSPNCVQFLFGLHQIFKMTVSFLRGIIFRFVLIFVGTVTSLLIGWRRRVRAIALRSVLWTELSRIWRILGTA